MALYLRNVYTEKNKKWVLIDQYVTRTSSELGRWQKDKETCQNSVGERMNYRFSDTKSRLNKKVDKVVEYFNGNMKSEMTLITTANKLGKKDKEKYKGIKRS